VIPFSSISQVATPRFENGAIIHKSDGKKVWFSVGNARKMRARY